MRVEQTLLAKMAQQHVIFRTISLTMLSARIPLLCLLTSVVLATEIEEVSPEQIGLSPGRLEPINQLAQRYVETKRVPGIQIMMNQGGKIVLNTIVGNRGLQDSRPLTKDDIYRIYSMTKPITAVAAMQLYEQGKFHFDDPVSKYIPELENLRVLKDGELIAANQPITMHQILTHTAGFSYGFDLSDPVDRKYREAKLWSSKTLDHFVEKLARLPLKYHPGTQWHYSVAVDVTGLAIERISGIPFDQYLRKHVLDPLDMVDTSFAVPKQKLHRLLPSQIFDYRRMEAASLTDFIDILGYMQPKDAMYDYESVTLFSGGGGLVSTTRDYMRFAEMLRGGGVLKGTRILTEDTIKDMTRNHLPTTILASGTGEDVFLSRLAGYGFGLGFGVVTDPTATKSAVSKGTFMWGGAAATIFWVDPAEEIVVLGMMQLLTSPYQFREELRNAVYGTIKIVK